MSDKNIVIKQEPDLVDFNQIIANFPIESTSSSSSFQDMISFLPKSKPNPDGSVTCKLCGKTLANTTTLSMHMRIHTGEKPHHCTMCSRQFRQKQHLQRHLRVHTRGSGFDCHFCRMTFGRELLLRKHLLKVHGLDMSSQKSQYSIKTEDDESADPERKFVCLICDKRFKQKWHLKRHEQVHQRGSVTQCPICRKFVRKTSMPTHMMIHTGEKPFPCRVCGHRFAQKQHVARHELVHLTKKAGISCHFCGRIFQYYSSLFTHLIIYHNYGKEESNDPREVADHQEEAMPDTDYDHAFARLEEELAALKETEDYQCIFCLKCFSCAEDLYDDLEEHSKVEL